MSTSLIGGNIVPVLVVFMSLLVVWYVVRDDEEHREVLRTFTVSYVVGIVVLYSVLGILYYPGR